MFLSPDFGLLTVGICLLSLTVQKLFDPIVLAEFSVGD
jgi:hypothetical protein